MKNIIKVPKSRKLKKYTPLHESFFDDDEMEVAEDIFTEDTTDTPV